METSEAKELSGGFPSHSAESLFQPKQTWAGGGGGVGEEAPSRPGLSTPVRMQSRTPQALQIHQQSITFGQQPRLIICYESLCSHKNKWGKHVRKGLKPI